KYAKGIIVGHNGRLIVYSVNKDVDFNFLKVSINSSLKKAQMKYNTSEKIHEDMLSSLKKLGLINYRGI
ncbi:head protein, partial [Staphylococcus pseudintermedius]